MWREKGEETNWGWEEGGGQETVKGSEDEWLVLDSRVVMIIRIFRA